MTQLDKIWREIPEWWEDEDVKTAPFRTTILVDQIGDVCRHISHDPSINPNTRPLDEPEETAYADAIWQLLALANARDVDMDRVCELAISRMEDQAGYQNDSGERGSGTTAWNPDNETKLEGVIGQDILLTGEFNSRSQEIKGWDAIVTEHGGVTCHAAILAREMDVPFIVGVRDVTDLFGEGDRIEIDFENAVVQSA